MKFKIVSLIVISIISIISITVYVISNWSETPEVIHCGPPSAQTGYVIDLTHITRLTTQGVPIEVQGASCDTGSHYHGSVIIGTCNAGEQVYTLSGCDETTCSPPPAQLGYTIQDTANSITVGSQTINGVSCDAGAGYIGTTIIGSCNDDGSNYTLEGCAQPETVPDDSDNSCAPPISQPGYIINDDTLMETTVSGQDVPINGVSCDADEGFSGNIITGSCTANHSQYILSGCTNQCEGVICDAPNSECKIRGICSGGTCLAETDAPNGISCPDTDTTYDGHCIDGTCIGSTKVVPSIWVVGQTDQSCTNACISASHFRGEEWPGLDNLVCDPTFTGSDLYGDIEADGPGTALSGDSYAASLGAVRHSGINPNTGVWSDATSIFQADRWIEGECKTSMPPCRSIAGGETPDVRPSNSLTAEGGMKGVIQGILPDINSEYHDHDCGSMTGAGPEAGPYLMPFTGPETRHCFFPTDDSVPIRCNDVSSGANRLCKCKQSV